MGRLKTSKLPAHTKGKRKEFLRRLAEDPTANVTRCAEGLVSTQSLYEWRKKDPAFAAAWAGSVEHVFDEVKDAALTRVVDGVPELVLHEGKAVYVHTACNSCQLAVVEGIGEVHVLLDGELCPGLPVYKRKYPEMLTAKFLTALDPEDRFRDKQHVQVESKGVMLIPGIATPEDWEKTMRQVAIGGEG